MFAVTVSYSQDKGVKFEDGPPSNSPTLEETPLLDEDTEENDSPPSKKGKIVCVFYPRSYMYINMLVLVLRRGVFIFGFIIKS